MKIIPQNPVRAFIYFLLMYTASVAVTLLLFSIPTIQKIETWPYITLNYVSMIASFLLIAVIETRLCLSYFRNAQTNKSEPIRLGLFWLVYYVVFDFLFIVLIMHIGFGIYQYADIWLYYSFVMLLPSLLMKQKYFIKKVPLAF
jgi:hypothetical protein